MSNPDLRPSYPDGIEEDHARPVSGLRHHASPLGLVAFGSVVILAAFGLLGRERTWSAEGGGARLTVHTSEIIRNGEFFELRIGVEALEPIGELVVGVEDDLWEDMTVNTILPGPADEENLRGETRFSFAELGAGESQLLKLDLQVNPDILGANEGTVTVYDGADALASTDLSITVLP